MTTDAERGFYYQIVKENAGKGAIVEFGAWLGASTAYIAAAIRDSGYATRAHVYDKFLSKPGHVRKVEAFYEKHEKPIPTGPSLEQFKANLGPLLAYVKIHHGQIEDQSWNGERIAVLITDAPKRVPAISAVLTNFRKGIGEGTVMAWQDFCHFPSYEIPAALYRLRQHLEFIEAVVPGTTLAFTVKSRWTPAEVSLANLTLHRWTPKEIAAAWDYWLEFVPAEKAELFKCGQAMFLCDIGQHQEAVKVLGKVDPAGVVGRKWEYLRENRPDFVVRYRPLFHVMAETC
jgi:hypothetical protein